MFLPGWSIWYVVLTLQASVYGLEISGYGNHEVNCPQGLSNCALTDSMLIRHAEAEDDAVKVQNLTPYIKLCCKDGEPCALCLTIDIEINIPQDQDREDEEQSGHEEEYDAFVTVCYTTGLTTPSCKKVQFTVNHTALAQPNQAKLSMEIARPHDVSFSNQVFVYSSESPYPRQEVIVPPLDEVCSQDLQGHVVEECYVPRLSWVINHEMNWVELKSADTNKSLPSVCVQYEPNGRCVKWNMKPISMDSVTSCMCFQAWDEDGERSRRSLTCPFKTDVFQRKVWQNVIVSVDQRQMNNYRPMLRWNLSAPCRLEGEVWLCSKKSSCTEMKGFRQQLIAVTWKQNSIQQWENIGEFEDIDIQLLPCVMVKIKGMGRELGPFCLNETDRLRWSLLIVGVMLLVCLTVLIIYLLHGFVKKWAWSWRHGGFVAVGRMRHVVLLSPPDLDDDVLESVSRLGSLLCNQGFSVSVDQWSRNEQCTLGPLPWLHSQLLELNSQGGRIVLVVTRKALERVEEWTHWHKEVKGKDLALPLIGSPYSDLFMACLWLIQADKQLGRAGKRFLLVKFDSNPCSDRTLPELLQGLLLFKIPSQTQDLLTELSVGRAKRTYTV
uniref:uncharacterized protein il17rc n=1 Tax=Scatophagus argus TaxID=75038 RepID=UPI001ED8297B|nr:uncharacterized protein il17rc [Scatophagus argus]